MKLSINARQSISWKLIATVFSIYFLVTFSVTAAHMFLEYKGAGEKVRGDLKSLAKVFSPGMSAALWDMNQSQAAFLMKGMMDVPVVVGVKALDEDGGLVHKEGRVGEKAPSDEKSADPKTTLKSSEASDKDLIVCEYPLTRVAEGEKPAPLGTLYLYSSDGVVFNNVKGGFSYIIINAMIKTFALWVIFLLVSRRILTRPLSALTQKVSELDLNNLHMQEIEIHSTSRNELTILRDSFNEMIRKLLRERDKITETIQTFEKFIPRQLVKRFDKEGGGSLKLGGIENSYYTILSGMIHSFGEISDRLDAEEGFQYLNSYLTAIEKPVEAYGGIIDKFIGDSSMSIFDLQPDYNEALYVIHAAIAMQEELNKFNELKSFGMPPLSTGIGIHSGDVRIGTLGSQNRMDSSMIGEAVSIASRLSRLTKTYNSLILVSEKTINLLKDKTVFLHREIDMLKFSGLKIPIRVYEIFEADPIETKKAKQSILSDFSQGISAFRQRQWDEAIRRFETCLRTLPDDAVSRIYINRCRDYQSSPPGKHWSAVFALEEVCRFNRGVPCNP